MKIHCVAHLRRVGDEHERYRSAREDACHARLEWRTPPWEEWRLCCAPETWLHADYSFGKDRGESRGNARKEMQKEKGMTAGGDGQARTADPLLAKQVLSQLSYIPGGTGHGGPFWIRTRDLTVISRALSPTELKARGEPRCPALRSRTGMGRRDAAHGARDCSGHVLDP
jgi:hypothetical protein